MPRVAILGGGIAGLAAAFECEQQRQAGHPVDWHLFEASARLGHTVSTTRLHTPDGDYLLEDGPDGWITEKRWAQHLAEELGLGSDLLPCNEATKKTYLWLHGELTPMPARMRLMVPEDLSTLDTSPLFTPAARQAYHAELTRAAEFRAAAPHADESVASFVLRHFGPEVLDKIAAPLLSGVFGGDVHRLSVRAVMPQFVLMEAQHGSLIAALQARAQGKVTTPPSPGVPSERSRSPGLTPTFTSLRRGMGSLVEALVAALPPDRLHTGNRAAALSRSSHPGRSDWLVRFTGPATAGCSIGFVPFDEVLLATPPNVTAALLQPTDPEAAALIPTEASSAVLATFCWPPALATFDLPPGFGFLVPKEVTLDLEAPKILAGTFTAQKFPHRAPTGAHVIRVFFSGTLADSLQSAADGHVAALGLQELRRVLPYLPDPDPTLTTVRRWPRSLPQYEVGHLDRMVTLQKHVHALGHLHLLGNGYHGVGVPDLIRDARTAAKSLVSP